MPARLTAYLPNAAAWCLLREHSRIRIGRDPQSEFQVDHPSVSRCHAELTWQHSHWRLRDLDSKNGSFVEGVRVQSADFGDQAWFRVGDVACEFSTLSEDAADHAELRLAVKRASSAVMLEGIAKQTALPDILQETVRAIVELAGCERGFLLFADRGILTVAASHGLDTAALRSQSFRGSVGVAQRALDGQVPVVINEASTDPGLAGRDSIIAGGLRTLVCIPLLAGGECIGLAYADSSQPGALITTMDLELLCAFAERAALWIAARRGMDAIVLMTPARPAWTEILDAQQLASA